MRIVTIAAGNALRKHPALLERAIIVDFVLHLPVGMIEPAAEGRYRMGFGERLAGLPVLGKFAAPRVTQSTGLNFPAQRHGRDAALRIAGFRVPEPRYALTLVQERDQTLEGIVALSKRRPALAVQRPAHVERSLAVAGFATDTDFGP